MPEGEDQYLFRIEHGGYAYRHGLLGHLVHVVVEEARVHDQRVVGQCLDAGARVERRERLVEGQMAVFADTAQEEVDAPCAANLLLVFVALLLQVGGVAVEDVDIGRGDVHVVEKGVPHERMVAFGMLFREPDVFVHVERDDILERYLPGLVQGDQLLVRRQRGRTRRQAQHERASGSLLLVDLPDDVMRRPTAGIFLCVFDNESHIFFGLSVCLFILHSDGRQNILTNTSIAWYSAMPSLS